MRKYLLTIVSTIAVLSHSIMASRSYDDVDHNEDVLRKINLDQYSCTEITTDIKFKTANG
jgi:hypothetical protein